MPLLLHVKHSRERWTAALRERLPECELLDVDATPEQLAEVRHALVWRQPHGAFARMPKLEAVFVLGAGVDWTLGDPSLPAHVPVIRLADAGMAEQLVDYHLHAALYFQRDFDVYARDQAAKRWQPRPPRPPLRTTVLGVGVLGEAVARALLARGFPVRGWARRPRSMDGLRVDAGLDALDELLGETDLLIALLPHTPMTAGLLDRTRLSKLPTGAAIINAGRGSLLDQTALLELLDAGHLRGAFLDVMAEEPPPDTSPLWTHPSVRLTPHVAAATLIVPAVEQVVANLEALARGDAPTGLVARAAGY